MYSADRSLRTGEMFDDVIEAHDVETVSLVVNFLNWLGLDTEKPSHILRGLKGDFDPFWMFPSLFGGGLKEPTEAAADIQDVAGSVVGKIFRRFRPQFSFPASSVLFRGEFFEAAGIAGKALVKFFLSFNDCPEPWCYVYQSAPATAHMAESFFFEEELWVVSTAQVTGDVDPLLQGGLRKILETRGHIFLRRISIRDLFYLPLFGKVKPAEKSSKVKSPCMRLLKGKMWKESRRTPMSHIHKTN
jgi:hypothetical protein